jgi:hypothetical protein
MYGICLTHEDYHFTIANLPAVRQETFTPHHLSEIFKYWLKGYFFYQPEVFFSKKMWDRAGGKLDDRLYYTMDYKLWFTCAQNHARVEAVHWPFALFRQHAEQKTRNLLDCILEQATVRDAHVRIEPGSSRRMEVSAKLRRALGRSQVRVGVVSSRLSKIFSLDAAEDLASFFEGEKYAVRLAAAPSDLGEVDLLIKLIHLQGDAEELRQLQRADSRRPLVGWFWDNHHHLFENVEVAELLDVVLPGHAFASSYLRNDRAVEGASIPLCVSQWSRREAAGFYKAMAGRPRTEKLYGGFVSYAFAKKRDALIESLIERGCDGVKLLQENNLRRYFGLPPEDRFRDWMEHKVSICLPLAGDLSQRLFDALITGQVPIVPDDIRDLDLVIPPDEQARLPIVRFTSYDPEEAMSAHRRALELFDRDGEEGAARRHAYARDRHTFPVRIRAVLEALETLSRTL